MKLRFFMSHRRKNSVRDKVIAKKWIYLERYTFHRQCAPSQKARMALGEAHSIDRECGPSQKTRGPEIQAG